MKDLSMKFHLLLTKNGTHGKHIRNFQYLVQIPFTVIQSPRTT